MAPHFYIPCRQVATNFVDSRDMPAPPCNSSLMDLLSWYPWANTIPPLDTGFNLGGGIYVVI